MNNYDRVIVGRDRQATGTLRIDYGRPDVVSQELHVDFISEVQASTLRVIPKDGPIYPFEYHSWIHC